MKRVPKIPRQKKADGGPTKYPDIKKGEALPAGAVTGNVPGQGYDLQNPGKIVDENGKVVGFYYNKLNDPNVSTPKTHYVPGLSPASESTDATASTDATTHTPVTAATNVTPPTPTKTATPTPVTPKSPKDVLIDRAKDRDEFKKNLDAWTNNPTAQSVPTAIANEVQNNIRKNVIATQSQFQDAFKKKYGDKYNPATGPTQSQFLSKDEAIGAIGKDNYNNYLADVKAYEAYRAKTMGTYNTQNVTWGKYDPNEEMIGFRHMNLFKNTPEQSASNVKMTPELAMDYQAHPEKYTTNPSTITPKTDVYMEDGDNQRIPGASTAMPTLSDLKNKDIRGFKKGGGIPKGFSKRKGYADGNVVTPDSSQLTPEQLAQYNSLSSDADKAQYLASITQKKGAGNIMSSLPYAAAGQIAGMGIDMIKTDPLNKNAVIGKEAGATALKRAGAGAAIGANPLLMTATGGLSLPIGAAAGAIEGGIEGMLRGRKQYQVSKDQQSAQNAMLAQYGTHTLNPAGLAEGGKIKGPGTAKSDSINAEIPEGSFIVPAENAKKAERLRMAYFGKDSKMANLKEGGVPVKLSNGEHMFTPEEVGVLTHAGVDLDALAPNAETTGYGKQNGGSIHIAKSKEGTFTEAAKRHGKGVQEFAAHVLANKDDYSPDMVKKANFAHNAAGWNHKADGGPVNTRTNQGAVHLIPEKGDHFEFADGGHVSADKAKEILRDGTAQGHPLTDKQKRYFGWIAGGMKNEGGFISAREMKEFRKGGAVVMGYKDGGDVHGDPEQVEKDYTDLQAQYNAEVDVAKKKAILDKISALQDNYDYWQNHPKEKADYIFNKAAQDPNFGKEVVPATKTAPSASTSTSTSAGSSEPTAKSSASDIAAAQQEFLAAHDNPQTTSTTTAATDAGGKTATSTDAIANLKKQYDDLTLAGKIGDANVVQQQMHDLGYDIQGNKIGYGQQPSTSAASVMANLGTSDAASSDQSAAAATVPVSPVKNVFDSLGGASGLLALGQVGLGIWQGASHKAPVDHIDPALVKATRDAQQRATYGMSAPEMAANKAAITQSMRNTMDYISGASGGNAGMAVANARLAATDANQSNLQLAATDEALKLQKQQYADTMTAAMDARKYQQYSNDWNWFLQNQQAASNLIGAGLTNIIGASELNKTNQQINQRAQMGSTANIFASLAGT